MAEKRILVVDDEEQIRDLFTLSLTRAGFTVQSAASAEEALDIMQKKPAWVLFLDLNLPGMNGVDLCRQIRDQWPMAIAIAVTGYASLFELHDCRKAGFEDYYTKPVKMADLLTAAETAFAKLARWKQR